MEQKELVIFESEDQAVSLKVPVEEETVWLTQAQMTRLFSVDRTVITRHVNNVFRDEELDEKSNVHFYIANSDKPVKLYSLDVIIPVGYRIKSKRGIEFRRWANKVLKDYILKGYAVNHNRISQLGEVIILKGYAVNHNRISQLGEVIDTQKYMDIPYFRRI